MKLTERDKKLLLTLAYFVIIVGFGAFVFRPLINYYRSLGDQLALLEARKDEMDAQLAKASGLEKRRDELADLFRISMEDFYPMLESQEVDREVTGIVLSCGMKALYLNIVMPEEGVTPVLYPYAEEMTEIALQGDKAAGMSKGDTTADMAAVKGGTPANTAGRTYIYAPIVTVTAAGSKEQAEELIDKLTREYPGIRLRSYSRQVQSRSGDRAEDAGETELLSLELELYMCDRSVPEQGEKP